MINFHDKIFPNKQHLITFFPPYTSLPSIPSIPSSSFAMEKDFQWPTISPMTSDSQIQKKPHSSIQLKSKTFLNQGENTIEFYILKEKLLSLIELFFSTFFIQNSIFYLCTCKRKYKNILFSIDYFFHNRKFLKIILVKVL